MNDVGFIVCMSIDPVVLFGSVVHLVSSTHVYPPSPLLSTPTHPEYVAIGLAQVTDPTSGVRADILRRTLPMFTGSSPTLIPTVSDVYRSISYPNSNLSVPPIVTSRNRIQT